MLEFVNSGLYFVQDENKSVVSVTGRSGSGSGKKKVPDQAGQKSTDPTGSGSLTLLFSPDQGPTCNNGFIKLFTSSTKYNPELTNSSIK